MRLSYTWPHTWRRPQNRIHTDLFGELHVHLPKAKCYAILRWYLIYLKSFFNVNKRRGKKSILIENRSSSYLCLHLAVLTTDKSWSKLLTFGLRPWINYGLQINLWLLLMPLTTADIIIDFSLTFQLPFTHFISGNITWNIFRSQNLCHYNFSTLEILCCSYVVLHVQLKFRR
jgi:hypothetical protein